MAVIQAVQYFSAGFALCIIFRDRRFFPLIREPIVS